MGGASKEQAGVAAQFMCAILGLIWLLAGNSVCAVILLAAGMVIMTVRERS